ncbi:MAG TPA: A/G-specific adenine glycosylase [Baekduia sp.]|nr:A/G-specific adenine glycosylase [Baekduia sp.]
MDPAGALLDWFGREGRDLPWRRTRDPYAVLVAEVMLQQTQVARVVARYEAWLERWPDEAALAAAPLDEVLRAWVGLGYNRRAVRLREACAVVARDGWPADHAGLLALPGVGPYTAAAVACFAFEQPVLPVDTNVARVLERLGRPLAAPDSGRSWAFGQAVMELGATVCRAREAACGRCPVAAWCTSAHAVAIPDRAPAGTRVRFEDTDRWARGRVVAALAAGEGLPAGIEAQRLARAVSGLVRDGLVVRTGTGIELAR